MNDSISTDGPQRPRVRRGLGVLVGVTLIAAPLALAPAASAQSSGGPLGGSDTLLQGLLEGLLGGNTAGNLIGNGSTKQTTCYRPADGLSANLNCLAIVPLSPLLANGPGAKARIKARRTGSSIRWVK